MLLLTNINLCNNYIKEWKKQFNCKKSYSKNKAMIYEVPLDESSGYTHIYLTSIVHNDVKELRRRLKRQFSLINSNGTVPIENMKRWKI